LLSLVDIPVI